MAKKDVRFARRGGPRMPRTGGVRKPTKKQMAVLQAICTSAAMMPAAPLPVFPSSRARATKPRPRAKKVQKRYGECMPNPPTRRCVKSDGAIGRRLRAA